MPYVKPHTWLAGDELNDNNLNTNEDRAREYLNNNIETADITLGSLDGDNLQKGEYEPISKDMSFMSGEVAGLNTLTNTRNRAYFTSETKANGQTSLISYWQSVFNCCETVYCKEAATVFVSFDAYVKCNENQDGIGWPHKPGRGQWTSIIKLQHKTQYGEQTFGVTERYSTENTGAPLSPGALIDIDPDSFRHAGSFIRRVNFHVEIPASQGVNSFNVVINPTVEMGSFRARNFVVEVFYI